MLQAMAKINPEQKPFRSITNIDPIFFSELLDGAIFWNKFIERQ